MNCKVFNSCSLYRVRIKGFDVRFKLELLRDLLRDVNPGLGLNSSDAKVYITLHLSFKQCIFYFIN